MRDSTARERSQERILAAHLITICNSLQGTLSRLQFRQPLRLLGQTVRVRRRYDRNGCGYLAD